MSRLRVGRLPRDQSLASMKCDSCERKWNNRQIGRKLSRDGAVRVVLWLSKTPAVRAPESLPRCRVRRAMFANSGNPPASAGAPPTKTSSRTIHTRARAERDGYRRAAPPMWKSRRGDGRVHRGGRGASSPTPCARLDA